MANNPEGPERLRVLKRLSACLSEIHPGLATGKPSSYVNDLRPTEELPKGRVFRGRVLFGDDDPLPMVSILEVPLPPEQIPGAPDNENRTGSWELILQGFVDDDFENPTDPAQVLLADVVMRLAVEKRKNHDYQLFGMGNTVTNLHIGVGVVRPPDEISAKAYFWLPVRLQMAECLTDPYGDDE